GTQIRAQYLAGCDGRRSTIRKALGLRLHGQTPDIQLMAVGDVEVDGLGRDAWHQWFAGDAAIMLCPLPGTDAFQVQASHELGPDGTPLEPTLKTFQQTFDRIAGIPGCATAQSDLALELPRQRPYGRPAPRGPGIPRRRRRARAPDRRRP